MKTFILGLLIGVTAPYALYIFNPPEPAPIVQEVPEFVFVEPVAEPTNDYVPPPRFSAEEVLCLQENIFFEAATESDTSRKAVASVTLNRVAHEDFPSTICGVVKEALLNSRGFPRRHKCQFSWYCDGKSDEPELDNAYVKRKWDEIGELAEIMANGDVEDTVDGSVFYHKTTVKPDWDYNKLVVHDTVGAHIFYTNAE